MASELVAKYGLFDAKPKSTPMSTAIKLQQDEDNLLDTDKYPYNELVGSMLYLSVCTRPDIAQAVGALARYMSKPTMVHWQAAKGVLRYIASTTTAGIVYKVEPSATDLKGFCDADYAGDLDTRRSTTGYAFILNGGAVSWSSRLQPTVAVSTTEAEYMAAAHAVKEALWLKKLMGDLCISSCAEPVMIYCDNQAAISLLKHPISSQRSKHIDVLHHFARERVARGEVTFNYCSTDRMFADFLTKAVPEQKFAQCMKGLGMIV